ncbi:Imm26 family immunity protein [Neobacillus sp. NRS-1170]|uniref:Imm26 family immunity protein n=1 Tax=Neobacillus sp. NRS-1170 TaxID=3233898 RepID=UPI003D266FD2
MVNIENFALDIGIVKIHLPDAINPCFMIVQSLGEEFDLETNYEAEEKLRNTIKSKDKDIYRKIKIDAEGGCVFINANSKQGNSILEVAIIINELVIQPFRQELTSEYIEEVRKVVTMWKCPKPQKWQEGDIFAIQLSDRSYGYGQILWHQNKKSSVTCAIFDCRSNEIKPKVDIVLSTVISVMTIKDLFNLNSGKWKVLGNESLVIGKSPVPLEHSGKSGVGMKIYQEYILSSFIEAYFAIKPWNHLPFKNNFMDTLLLPDVVRPENVIILTKEQKVLY